MAVHTEMAVHTQVTETWPSTHRGGRPGYVCMQLRNTVSAPHFRLSSSTVVCGSVRFCAVLCGSVRFCMAHPCSFLFDSKQPGHHLEWILFRFATYLHIGANMSAMTSGQRSMRAARTRWPAHSRLGHCELHVEAALFVLAPDPKQRAPQRSSCPGRLVLSRQRKRPKRAKSPEAGPRIKKNVLQNPFDAPPEVKTCSFGTAEFNGGN